MKLHSELVLNRAFRFRGKRVFSLVSFADRNTESIANKQFLILGVPVIGDNPDEDGDKG
jgi:hypothetical protein